MDENRLIQKRKHCRAESVNKITEEKCNRSASVVV